MARFPRVRRRWIVLVVVLLLPVAWYGVFDQDASVNYYRVIDDRTLVVAAQTCPSFWTRVTTVTEATSSVIVGVRFVRAPLPSTCSQIVELMVILRDPIADRTVIDASSGRPVTRT